MLSKTNLVSQSKSNPIRQIFNYNSNQMSQTFGEWLLTSRKSAKLTQEKVAERSGISKAYIGHLENARPHTTTGAKLTPSREKVIALAKAVGGNVNEALRLANYADEENVLPEFLHHIDFSVFNARELLDIESFIRFKLHEKGMLPHREQPEESELVSEGKKAA